MLKLYCPVGNFRGNKILIAAEYSEVPIQQVYVDMSTIKDKEYLKKNPVGKVPVIETQDGYIFESNSIMRYVARLTPSKGLYGENIYQQSLVDQWLDFCSNELEPSIAHLVYPILGWMAFDKAQNKKAWEDVNASLRILDNHLKLNNFLVGNRITIADLSVACLLVNAFRFVFVDKFRKTIANVTRWFEFVTSQAPFQKVYGKIRLCVKEFEPANIEIKAEGPSEKKEKKEQPKKEQPKKEQPKKEEKKEKPKKEEEDEEDKPKPKEKNPLDLLPPSSFNLFDFKTLYVNAPDKKEPMKFFWEHFDPAGYSLWLIKYVKAQGEGKILYQTNNLMNGFLQRLDEFRKYSFGVFGVYGDEPNFEIRGVMTWRGTDKPKEILEHPSYEWHTWEKLDPSNPEHRKIVEQYWEGLNEEKDVVEGLTARTAKYFK